MTDEGHESDPAEQPPVTPSPSSQPAGAGAPADLGTRFVARLIDFILLGFVYSIVVVPFVIAAIFADVSGVGLPMFGTGVGSFVSSLIFAVVTIAYFALMESNRGQTVGKMAMGIRTQGATGGNPTVEEGVKRNAWIALSIIPWIGGLAQLAAAIYIAVTISNSATNTGWHDEFAGGTGVIKTK